MTPRRWVTFTCVVVAIATISALPNIIAHREASARRLELEDRVRTCEAALHERSPEGSRP